MSLKKLDKANSFQEKHGLRREGRPMYHVTAPIGWLNDPNGFSVYKEKIHLFYQYHPYNDAWGPMHWGHCVTEDFLHWQDLPVALAPDQPYDNAGCFSGSAITAPNGEQALIYTGSMKVLKSGKKKTLQQQCLALGNGIHYKKDSKNPVISYKQLPQGFSPENFRDPKVFCRDGIYYLIAVGMNEAGNGEVLMYKSEDLQCWEFVSSVDSNDGSLGDMWECPDFFSIDDMDILIVSPMHMQEKDEDFHEGFGSVAILGKMDMDKMRLRRKNTVPLDYGRDFYAPQTTKTPDGRRVLIAWMQAWENYIKPKEQKWHGMMSFPRELTLEGSVLRQNPVREIKRAHVDQVIYENVTVNKHTKLNGIEGRFLDLTIEIPDYGYREFSIKLASDEENHIMFSYEPNQQTMRFSRRFANKYAESQNDAFPEQSFKIKNSGEKLKLRFLLDICSVELFVNDGLQTFSSTFYTSPQAGGIEFLCSHDININIEKYGIDLDKVIPNYKKGRKKASMKEIKIQLKSIEDVKSFVSKASGYTADLDLISHRYVIDAKSILGIFSLDLSHPITLRIASDDNGEIDDIIETMKDFIVE